MLSQIQIILLVCTYLFLVCTYKGKQTSFPFRNGLKLGENAEAPMFLQCLHTNGYQNYGQKKLILSKLAYYFTDCHVHCGPRKHPDRGLYWNIHRN